MKNKLLSTVFLVILCLDFLCPKASGQQPNTPLQFNSPEERIEWWRDSHFGMFIHWGPVSLTGKEIGWSRGQETPVSAYDSLYLRFNPENFNADNWVSIARAAGMKYIILTTKHHDGFCLWETAFSDYNIMQTPLKRDVVKELAAACAKQGIAFGAYYSICDWHHPDFPLTSPGGTIHRENSNLDRYTVYMKNQTAELINKYDPLFTIWFDMPQEFDQFRGNDVISHLKAIQPDIMINDRTGTKGDYETPEQMVGAYQEERPWETCMTIGNQWAWKPNDNIKSLEQCLQTLISTAGGNGNLLFNVGPMPNGEIEPMQVDRLKEMGNWLRKYGESIYYTRGGPLKPTDWGVTTRKGNKVFIHILKYFGEEINLEIPALAFPVVKYRLLTGGEMKFTAGEKTWKINIPKEFHQSINTIVELTLSNNAGKLSAVSAIPQSLSYNKKVTGSSYQDETWTAPESIVNGSYSGRAWSPEITDQQPWIEIDLGKPETFSKIILFEDYPAIDAIEVLYKSSGDWIPAYSGDFIPQINIKNVTAQYIHFNIKKFRNGIKLQEIVILK